MYIYIYMYVCIHPTYNKFCFFAFLYNRPERFIGPMLGILLLGISAGAIRPCMSAFGGDQYHPSQVSKSSYHDCYIDWSQSVTPAEYNAIELLTCYIDWSQSITPQGVWILTGTCEKVASDLEVRRWFSPGSQIFYTTYNWLVMTN